MHATPPTPTLPAPALRLVTFGSSKTILRVDQQYLGVFQGGDTGVVRVGDNGRDT
jgi:hypothetical protein